MITRTSPRSFIASLAQEFRAPGSQYRGKPFWAWNGKLEPEELRRQIREMHRMGLGGFFMHSRVGLATPYLSDEWFVCIDACVDEARRLGMEAWLYDEDRWPSGAAGGLVTRDPKHRLRCLKLEEISTPEALEWTENTIAAFVARVEGNKAVSVRRIPRGKLPKKLNGGGETILRFTVATGGNSDWFNGYTYLDTLNPEAVRSFIEVTHEAYRRRCGDHFGKAIPGIFTDEPNFIDMTDTAWAANDITAWTDNLPAVFQQRYGYDLIPHLPEIFYNCDGKAFTHARLNYHDCVTHLFVNSFARQIGEWCGQNGLAFTGHVLAEDTLSNQAALVGACMRFYEHMQAPGIDLLTQYARDYDTAKQCASVARQLGRKWRLTETYGCTGWDFPLAGHKALGDWQVALGINLRCQHLFWYTMEGEAKRDYPASIGCQSPWWEHYAVVEDYFARVHAVMTRGAEARDLLVIHPIESMWALCKKDWPKDPEVLKFDKGFGEMRDALLAEHLDFDYGDEEMLSRLARVRRRGGLALQVGEAAYRAVLVPPLKTMRATTLKLLKQFAAAGGTVVFMGEPAAFLDGKPSMTVQEFAAGCKKAPVKRKKLADAVSMTRRVSITDPNGREIAAALYLLREDVEACYLFVCNTGQDSRELDFNQDSHVSQRELAFPEVVIRGGDACKGTPVELDPATGKMWAAEAKKTPGGWEIHTSLSALGSRLFVIPKKRNIKAPARRVLADAHAAALNPRAWKIELTEPNVLVLDRPRFRIGDRGWRKAEEILRVDSAARAAMGLAPRGGIMAQPWTREKSTAPKRVSVELAYSFRTSALPAGPLRLALERPESVRIAVNGAPAPAVADGWWTDRSLRTVPLDPALFRRGRNEILLAVDYDEEHPGLESAFLLGDFGVRVNGTFATLTVAPSTLKTGDWGPQGLPFYSGSVRYRIDARRPRMRKKDRLVLRVPSFAGAAARVLVDGRPAGIIAWEPHEVDITDYFTDRAAMVEIEVIGHRRNSHGPLHLTDPFPQWIGPDQFVTTGEAWSDDYQFVTCGLLAPPELVVRR